MRAFILVRVRGDYSDALTSLVRGYSVKENAEYDLDVLEKSEVARVKAVYSWEKQNRTRFEMACELPNGDLRTQTFNEYFGEREPLMRPSPAIEKIDPDNMWSDRYYIEEVEID